jgi:hypothetical protein
VQQEPSSIDEFIAVQMHNQHALLGKAHPQKPTSTSHTLTCANLVSRDLYPIWSAISTFPSLAFFCYTPVYMVTDSTCLTVPAPVLSLFNQRRHRASATVSFTAIFTHVVCLTSPNDNILDSTRRWLPLLAPYLYAVPL